MYNDEESMLLQVWDILINKFLMCAVIVHVYNYGVRSFK